MWIFALHLKNTKKSKTIGDIFVWFHIEFIDRKNNNNHDNRKDFPRSNDCQDLYLYANDARKHHDNKRQQSLNVIHWNICSAFCCCCFSESIRNRDNKILILAFVSGDYTFRSAADIVLKLTMYPIVIESKLSVNRIDSWSV